ncbi:MAG: metallophosphoesterase [Syntrophomonadales bacterium]|jgi:predicted phosphohydrolase
MKVFAIGDLHLSNGSKPMDIFGEEWRDHDKKIAANWDRVVMPEDTVLIAGDTSWAMRLPEAVPDFEWIAARPGRKIMAKGNHCYFWATRRKMIEALNPHGIEPLNAECAMVGRIAVAATRGWITPGDPRFDPEKDKVVYQRELQRLERALAQVPEDADQVIAMMHFPPHANQGEETGFIELLREHGVDKVVYGHLHGRYLQYALTGIHWNMEFHCVSADYINFTPVQIL